ncbi:MAG: hypothetical protein VKJ86_10230 [Synechococcus sp.]|nr:hypothetical protein [Synechococcus sp.]
MTFPQGTDKDFFPKDLQALQLRPQGLRLGQYWLVMISLCLILLGVGGCTIAAAPREFAPDGSVIQRAIATKLQVHYEQLSQTIAASPPNLELKNIQVKQLDSFFLQKLPVYHLQGTYDLTLNFASQRNETRRRNAFDVYLQRQPEGKTWRSLEKNPQGWRSHPLPL